jgi:threonine dehydrogenase-like Zn-dependent dehydrogenase
MKSVFLTAPGKLTLQDTPAPRRHNPTEVLLRMRAVGICGSDIHYFKNGRIGDQIVQHPWIVGHECAATVAEVGPAVKTLRPGDAVVIDPLVACGNCDQCVERAITLIESGKMKTHALRTHQFPLAEAQKAFEMVGNYREGAIKAVIRLDSGCVKTQESVTLSGVEGC